MSHTKEPWNLSDYGALISGDPFKHSLVPIISPFIEEAYDASDKEAFENMKRIKGCVNALTGVSTEDLPGAVESLVIAARSAQYFLKLHKEHCPALDEALKPFQAREGKTNEN